MQCCFCCRHPLFGHGLVRDTPLELAQASLCNVCLCDALSGRGDADGSSCPGQAWWRLHYSVSLSGRWPRHLPRRHSTATWLSTFRPLQSWRLCWRCTGILACIALASLPASRCHRYRRCAGVVALVAPASSPSAHRHCCPCPTRIATSLALVSLP